MKKPIIVGFDPGTTAALAIIDTKGKLIFLKSKKGLKKSDAIKKITEMGKPLIVAGDRRPLPKSVEKLASSLGCKVYFPTRSLSLSEKRKLIHGFKDEVENDHEKDALAAALQSYKTHSKVFEKIEKLLSSLGLTELYEGVVESVIKGKVDNINEAINRKLTEMRKKKRKIKVKEEVAKPKPDKNIRKLKEKIKILESDVAILKEHNQKLKKKLRESEDKIKYFKNRLHERVGIDSLGLIKKSTERLKKNLEKSKSFVEHLKLFRKIELSGYEPIIGIDEIKSDRIRNLNEMIDLEERVLFTKKPENPQILNEYKIKALIIPNEPTKEILEKVDFPVIAEKDISIEKLKDISVMKREEFEKKLKEAKKTGFVEWIKGHKKRRL